MLRGIAIMQMWAFLQVTGRRTVVIIARTTSTSFLDKDMSPDDGSVVSTSLAVIVPGKSEMSTPLSHLLHAWLTQPGQDWQHSHWTPAVDIYQVAKGWLVKFDLAGVRPGDIQLKACGRRLTVSGRRGDWIVEESESCSTYSMEITYSQFERTIELPCEIENLETRTDYRDGMLLVRLTERGRAE